MSYKSANEYYRSLFGQKVYRIALDAGCTCPNRDGTVGFGGCIFCSGSGSGEFAASREKPIAEQVKEAKERVADKNGTGKYIAYFQNFTNTYGDEDDLKAKYETALSDPEVVGISIATRPDAISEKMYGILEELSKKTKVWIELGLQTIHEKTAKWMRRGYELPVFEEAFRHLSEIPGIDVIVHVIMDFPGETKEMMLETIDYCSSLPIHGIKIANLNILRDTDLEKEYLKDPFPLMEMDEYIKFLEVAVERLRPNIVIYRLTGDGAKKALIAPLWVGNKRVVRNSIAAAFRSDGVIQGKNYLPKSDH
ncbi:MAG: TIGR01212 family radical SAM protein [Clostridiales bacterium]|nr:TIGR01212 family radical SAM protein [Clostridiales bacterium]